MKNKVLATLVDQNHLEYAKALFASACSNGGWDGDYLILAHNIDDSSLSWFKEKGIYVKHVKPLTDYHKSRPGWMNIFIAKVYLFEKDMKKWEKVVYIDVDVIIRDSLERLTEVKTIAGVPYYHGRYHRYFGTKKIKSKNLFTSGIFSFDTSVIKSDTFEKMIEIAQNLHNDFPQGVDLMSHEELTILGYFNYQFERLPIVFNSVPLILSKKFYIKEKSIDGVIIHFASYDPNNKPWLKSNYFYPEWKKNLDKFSGIDLKKPIKIETRWSSFDIFLYQVRIKGLHQTISFIFNLISKIYYFIDRRIGLLGLQIKKYAPSVYEKIKVKKD